MTREQNNLLLEFFKCTTTGNASGRVDFNDMNTVAVPAGYFVMPEACNNDVFAFLKWATVDVNATFYKEWKDVTSKTREELLFDQMLHYATTYGTGFTVPPYIANDGPDNVPAYAKLKVITAISEDEMFTRCLDMLNSGIALDRYTVETVCAYICEYVKDKDGDYRELIGFDDIKNHEARCLLCVNLGIMPESPVELLRSIVYYNIGETMLINSYSVLLALENMPFENSFDFSTLDDEALKSLASIFYRYKRIFLALRGCKENAPYINRIRRYAKHYHQPMVTPFFNDILTDPRFEEVVEPERIKTLSAFKAVKLIQAIRERRLENMHDHKLYVIRNKKVFMKEANGRALPCDAFFSLEKMLYQHVVEKVKENTNGVERKTFRMPERVELGVPSSEKTFIGNYPFGTKVKCGAKNFVGVNWTKDSGWPDLDLHFYNMDGMHIGWNEEYRDRGSLVVFSGDMTTPRTDNGQASEVMMATKGMPDGIFVVTNYGYPSVPGRKVTSRVFVATTTKDVQKLHRGFMVDPNDVVLEGLSISNMKNHIIGLFEDNEFLVSCLACSDSLMFGHGRKAGRVVKRSGAADVIDALKLKSHAFMALRDLLEAAGFEEAKDGEEAGLDFTELSKDSIINLLK